MADETLFPVPAVEPGDPLFRSKAALRRALKAHFGPRHSRISAEGEIWVRTFGVWRLLGHVSEYILPTCPEDGPQQIDDAPMQESRP